MQIQKSTMETFSQPAWMQTVSCLNALKSDNEYAVCDLAKVHWGKQYLYYPECNSSELGCISFSPSGSGPSKSPPGPGGDHMWETDFPPTWDCSSPLMKTPFGLRSDVEAPSCTVVTESSWVLRTLHQLTFSSNYLDPYVYEDDEPVGHRYLYAPPSDISGFMDDDFPACTQINCDKWEPEGATSCCTETATSLLAEEEADEPKC
ncbi:uncharacterized protein LOC131993769 [Centropristis striata]|uniref:uncharacterized protein LOC131993769 n=1 Tax=Centropristis striata TaxID=184440 RepID=UPI0027E1DA5E|nr:uncharacterized protein LOC131993769 [Centropristis striata]